MAQDRSNLKAGLFVVGGVVAMFMVIVILADFQSLFQTKQPVAVRFLLEDGLKGLKVGAPVTIGGTPKGSVTSVADDVQDGVVVASIVHFTIPSEYKIYENAHLELDVPTIGTNTTLNIRSFGGAQRLGTHSGNSWEYEHGVDPPIPGGLATSEVIASAIRELGIEEQQRQEIRNIITNIDKLIDALGSDPKPIAEIIANINKLTGALADDVPKLTKVLNEDIPQITENVKTATADVKQLTGDVKQRYPKWLDEIDRLVSTANGALDKTDKVVVTVQAMLDENRANIKDAVERADAALTKAEQIADRVNDETLTKMNEALDKANESVANIRETTEDLRSFVVAQRPVVERTLGNFRIVADQLKLAAIEVRRSPWRLLYKPTERELETDNLYDAARSFAVAADSLNATADSLQAILERYGSTMNMDDPILKLMLDNLHQTFEKFTEAETKFWDALKQTPPASN